MTFHVRAWLAWLLAAAAFTVIIDNPFASVASMLALGFVAVAFRSPGPEGRTAALMFKVGLAVIVVRVVLFGLTGRPGSTTLFTLPSVGLPSWLGGFSVGGRISGEVVAQQVAEGLKIAAFLACFGVFLASVETYRILRLLPRFLFEAGLVVGIALTFVPSLLRSTAEVRDAQRLRGHTFRGIRSLKPLVVPVLANALERSLTLAASMESRGFGRRARAHTAEVRAHAAVLAGLATACAGGGVALAGAGFAGAGLALAGALLIAAGLRSLSVSVARTRLRPDPMDAWDLAMIGAAGVTVALTFAWRGLEAANWYAFPTFRIPEADVRLLLPAAGLAVPVPIARLRTLFHRAAEARHPIPETTT